VVLPALDVPVTLLRRRLPLNRPPPRHWFADGAGLSAGKVSELLLPERVFF